MSFTCQSCLFDTEHNWFALGVIKLANLPLAIETKEDIAVLVQSDPDYFNEKKLKKLLKKELSFEKKEKIPCQTIPNLNLCLCTKCKHKTLWFGKSKLK
jgi:hypothetical protein